jgi:hypothetical protein
MKAARKVEAIAYVMGVSKEWARKQLKRYNRLDMLTDDNCPSCDDTEKVTDIYSAALGGDCYCTIYGIPNLSGDKP